MVETIIFGLSSIYLAYLSRYKNLDWGLKLSFVLIFLFLSFRFDFGNDYQEYLNRFEQYKSEDLSFELFKDDLFEPGWIFLNWLFKDLGFFSMNIFLAFFSSLIYYHFIVKYVPSNYYWLAVFFYVFNTNFLLIQSSAMRQAVAIMLFVFSINYLNEKRLLKYIFCIAIASLFHYSALLLFAIYLLVFYKKRIGTIGVYIIFLFYIFLIVGSKVLAPYLIGFVSFFSDKYKYYQDEGVVNSGIGFVYYSFILLVMSYNEKKHERDVGLISKIAILSMLIMPLSLVLDMVGRFNIYLTPAIIVAYPNLISKIEKPLNRIIICTILCAFTLFQFYQFFYSETYNEYYMNYKTIFSATGWY